MMSIPDLREGRTERQGGREGNQSSKDLNLRGPKKVLF